METTKIRTDLLRQLAEHLLNGELGHKHFSFSYFNNSEDNVCGTSGCAAGECPILWPEQWQFKGREVRLIESVKNQGYPPPLSNYMVFEDLKDFFNLDEDMVNHLFVPSEYENREEGIFDEITNQNTEVFGGQSLGDKATKEEVANNILAFCDIAERGEI